MNRVDIRVWQWDGDDDENVNTKVPWKSLENLVGDVLDTKCKKAKRSFLRERIMRSREAHVEDEKIETRVP